MPPAAQSVRRLKRPAAVLVLTLICGVFGLERVERARTARAKEPLTASLHVAPSPATAERDSLHDGFPDAARIVRPEDRATFVHWLTFLAEAQYYAPSPEASGEIHDCAGLIRFAFRNALMAHNVTWRRSVLAAGDGAAAQIESQADFGTLHEFTYPDWALGANLFRTRAGPLAPGDLANGAFAQFADVATLLHYNTFFISRDVRAASPGDLFFYYQSNQNEAYHSMLFVGPSYFQPQGADWVVYHTGDINGRAGQVRELEVRSLMQIPDPRWRPLASNPRFLGVYRFELLR
jgi:uncharacterized protein YfaT (DUF1175 family)